MLLKVSDIWSIVQLSENNSFVFLESTRERSFNRRICWWKILTCRRSKSTIPSFVEESLPSVCWCVTSTSVDQTSTDPTRMSEVSSMIVFDFFFDAKLLADRFRSLVAEYLWWSVRHTVLLPQQQHPAAAAWDSSSTWLFLRHQLRVSDASGDPRLLQLSAWSHLRSEWAKDHGAEECSALSNGGGEQNDAQW